jgi:hypothetical protein
LFIPFYFFFISFYSFLFLFLIFLGLNMVWSIDNWVQNYVLTDHKFYIWPWLAAVSKQTLGAFGECAQTVRLRALDLHNQKMMLASVRKENCAVRKAKAKT